MNPLGLLRDELTCLMKQLAELELRPGSRLCGFGIQEADEFHRGRNWQKWEVDTLRNFSTLIGLLSTWRLSEVS